MDIEEKLKKLKEFENIRDAIVDILEVEAPEAYANFMNYVAERRGF